MVYLNDHLHDFDLAQAWQELSLQRQTYLSKFRREDDRRAGAAAYLLLRQGLEAEYGIHEAPSFDFGPHGKPSLQASSNACALPHPLPIYFNLSHCAEVAACAIHTRPVGIDVESLSAYDPELLPTTMSTAEQEAIFSANSPALAFISLWTLKEAYLKLFGTGITDDLPNLFGPNPPRPWESLAELTLSPFWLSESGLEMPKTNLKSQADLLINNKQMGAISSLPHIFYQTRFNPQMKYVCSVCYILDKVE